ncbi:hypothetical protein RZS28_07660 [Methylocapsa polymorpha]|uniref:Uncharacterized protein n=1 Tax=Methylocapsa polymorpha TaxID=3080828 RepID=A0ABZ0HWJ2_9HYPH|nr:hypothetical protein RZS28_07660 [Methylocapsa sp. RX1]
MSDSATISESAATQTEVDGEPLWIAETIAVTNSAGFVMSFRVENDKGKFSPRTDNYPIGQTERIDLKKTDIAPESKVWPVVNAIFGKTESAKTHILYRPNGVTASYIVTGTTLNYSIEFVGVK